MAEVSHFPDGLGAAHAEAPGGTARHASPLSLLVLGALMLAAVLGLLAGGKTRPLSADGLDARLTVATPRVVRNGIFFETRIRIEAHRALSDATIAIAPSLWRDMTINTKLPEASEEEFTDGMVRLHYGPLAAGEQLEVKFDGQINPPLFAGTRGAIVLLDDERRLAGIPLSITVLP